MKKYFKEIIILLLQIFILYILPLLINETNVILIILLMILLTLILSLILGIISNNKIKYIYPIIVAILFIPTILIYYNNSALIHSIWYLFISSIGILLGSIIKISI